MLKVPRTFKKFSALMAMTLTKLKVRSNNGSATLLTVIKNPVTNYLPMNIEILGTSNKAEEVNLNDFVKTLGVEKKPLCFVIGAVSVGNPGMENELVTRSISISKHGLTAANVCGKLVVAMEKLWKIV